MKKGRTPRSQKEIDELQEEVLTFLRTGRKNAISSIEIARSLDLPETHRTMVFIASVLMRPLVIKYLIPIGGEENGFFLFADRKEVEDSIESLRGRITGIQARIRALKKIIKSFPKSK